jgi:hypothetical protein
MPLQASSDNHVIDAGAMGAGIVTLCYGKRGYYAAAEHLAITLSEHSPGVPLTVYAERPELLDATLFHQVVQLDGSWLAGGPGSAKVRWYDMLPEGSWLVMDVDSLVHRDVRPFLDQLMAHDFAMEVLGRGAHDKELGYFPWATVATINERMGLPDGTVHYAVQSSWMWVRKPSPLAAEVFARAQAATYGQADLKERWGNDIPDELRFSSALAVMQPALPDIKMSFYGNGTGTKGLSSVPEPILCLYGDDHRRRLVRPGWMAAYDRYLRQLYMKRRRTLYYPVQRVMRDKYVNT